MEIKNGRKNVAKIVMKYSQRRGTFAPGSIAVVLPLPNIMIFK